MNNVFLLYLSSHISLLLWLYHLIIFCCLTQFVQKEKINFNLNC